MSLRLVIKEYLGSIKERGELDAILPDVLLTMGYHNEFRPKTGINQYGVDVLAIGKEQSDGEEKLWIFLIKPHNIDRNGWNEPKQGVRDSLHDIVNQFIPIHIPDHYKDLKQVIVVVCGGELEQNMHDNWNGFISNVHKHSPELEFKLWDGDRLSQLIEKHLLNEYILTKERRGLLRKCIALIDEPEQGIEAYKELLNQLKPSSTSNVSTRIRRVITANCVLRVIFGWGILENNLTMPYEAAELLLLWTWDVFRGKNLIHNKKVTKSGTSVHKVIASLLNVYHAYFRKIAKYCYMEDGLTCYSANKYESSIFVFNTIGKLAVVGYAQLNIGIMNREEANFQNAKEIANCIEQVIVNNGVAKAPLYDGHIVDITLAATYLLSLGNIDSVKLWIRELVGATLFAYQSSTYYPISTDNYDDLIDSHNDGNQRYKQYSTLYPVLAELCILLGDVHSYNRIVREIGSSFENQNYQMWYPDEATDNYLYIENATRHSGICYISHEFPDSYKEFENEIINRSKTLKSPTNITCENRHFPCIEFIANRQFRTPVFPKTWQSEIVQKANNRP